MNNSGFYLDFERDLVELEKKIDELKSQAEADGLNLDEGVRKLEAQAAKKRREIYANLSPWQRVQISRHPNRPYALDYVERMLSDFTELHGDRLFADDASIIGGPARLDDESVMVIGIQSGRNLEERQKRNFGMPHPEGYRKARRLMQMAAKFKLPVLTLVDTSGAYPGIEAEERGQAEAIARNLYEMSHLPVPIVVAIIGQAFSGGAIGITVGDRDPNAGARLLFGDCAGELLDDFVQGARAQRGSGRGPQAHGGRPEATGNYRPHCARAIGRRPPQLGRCGQNAQTPRTRCARRASATRSRCASGSADGQVRGDGAF